jgi:nucleoside-diphosphate-sugar epimerase
MTSRSKQLLVTGASGFLGSRVVDLALHAGWQVRAFDRSPRTQIEGVETFVGDIGDSALLRKAIEGVTAIVHAAGLAHVFGPSALDSARFNAVNELGTANVVDAALKEGVSHIILVSSVSVYGDYLGARCDETVPCYPKGPYAMSKWKGELRATERMADERGFLTILRFATIYGEGDRGNVARLIRALESKRFIWSGSGQNKKSLIYKEDAARACLCALDRHESAVEVFNVSAPPSTMREIVTPICEALGRPVPRLSLPLSVLRTAGAISRKIGDPWDLDQRLQKFVRDDVYDGSKFEARFGFCPAVSLSEGLRKEVNSLRSQPKR